MFAALMALLLCMLFGLAWVVSNSIAEAIKSNELSRRAAAFLIALWVVISFAVGVWGLAT